LHSQHIAADTISENDSSVPDRNLLYPLTEQRGSKRFPRAVRDLRSTESVAGRRKLSVSSYGVIDFDTSTHYHYRPMDLTAVVINSQRLLHRETKETPYA
jgi:hypothetical protein